MKKEKLNPLACIAFALLTAGCAREIDTVVAPINTGLEGIKTSVEQIEVPIEGISDTTVRIRRSKIIIRKTF